VSDFLGRGVWPLSIRGQPPGDQEGHQSVAQIVGHVAEPYRPEVRSVNDVEELGEGRLDSQTGQGKIVSAILARNPGKPVYAVMGSVSPDLGGYAENFASITVASDADAMRVAGSRLAESLCVSRG